MKKIILSFLGVYAASAFAGSVGTGTPPSFESIHTMVMSDPSMVAGGLFTDVSGSVGLGINGQLDSTIVLQSNADGNTRLDSNVVPVSEADLATLQEKKTAGTIQIDVTSISKKAGTTNESRSYYVEDSEVAGELILVEVNSIH